MNKKITLRFSAIMIAATFVATAPHSASAGGFSKLKSPKISGQIVGMNGKMAPKKRPNKSSGAGSNSASSYDYHKMQNIKISGQFIGMNGKMAPKKR